MSAELKAVEIKPMAQSAVVTAAVNGAAFDLRPYDGEVKLVLSSAAGTGTNPTLDVKIQHSDDGATGWADTGTSFAQVTNAAGGSYQVLNVTAEKFKRYIRTVDAVGGTTPSFARGVHIVGSRRA